MFVRSGVEIRNERVCVGCSGSVVRMAGADTSSLYPVRRYQMVVARRKRLCPFSSYSQSPGRSQPLTSANRVGITWEGLDLEPSG